MTHKVMCVCVRVCVFCVVCACACVCSVDLGGSVPHALTMTKRYVLNCSCFLRCARACVCLCVCGRGYDSGFRCWWKCGWMTSLFHVLTTSESATESSVKHRHNSTGNHSEFTHPSADMHTQVRARTHTYTHTHTQQYLIAEIEDFSCS